MRRSLPRSRRQGRTVLLSLVGDPRRAIPSVVVVRDSRTGGVPHIPLGREGEGRARRQERCWGMRSRSDRSADRGPREGRRGVRPVRRQRRGFFREGYGRRSEHVQRGVRHRRGALRRGVREQRTFHLDQIVRRYRRRGPEGLSGQSRAREGRRRSPPPSLLRIVELGMLLVLVVDVSAPPDRVGRNVGRDGAVSHDRRRRFGRRAGGVEYGFHDGETRRRAVRVLGRSQGGRVVHLHLLHRRVLRPGVSESQRRLPIVVRSARQGIVRRRRCVLHGGSDRGGDVRRVRRGDAIPAPLEGRIALHGRSVFHRHARMARASFAFGSFSSPSFSSVVDAGCSDLLARLFASDGVAASVRLHVRREPGGVRRVRAVRMERQSVERFVRRRSPGRVRREGRRLRPRRRLLQSLQGQRQVLLSS
mmetsp:Transcript_49305/g.148444  ORF Transcript_49305/g.148444 Transcript_49305/m.148444 type:complete len:419 (-) Transcript_49305:102-1358(-)